MTLSDVRNSLMRLGFETVDADTHMSNPSGKIHVYLEPKESPYKDSVTIKRFANAKMFGYNMPETEYMCLACDIDLIYKNGNRITFRTNNSKNNEYREDKENNTMLKTNEEVFVKYAFEVNTNDNIRFITFVDYTTSKATYHADYYVDSKEWDGDNRSVNEILSALMSLKMTIDSFEDGITEVYSDGKTKLFR